MKIFKIFLYQNYGNNDPDNQNFQSQHSTQQKIVEYFSRNLEIKKQCFTCLIKLSGRFEGPRQ